MADPQIPGGIRVLAQLFASTSSEDVVSVNSWVFAMVPAGAVTEAGRIAAMDALGDFYEAIWGVMGSPVGTVRFKSYDMDEEMPRTPLEGTELPLGNGGQALPSEVAICLSFFNGTVPRPRRRGRVYLGPVAASAAQNSGQFSIVSTTARDTIADAATTLAALSGPVRWGILSGRDQVIRQVERGWVDGAWDIQRRRGEDPTVRHDWPA